MSATDAVTPLRVSGVMQRVPVKILESETIYDAVELMRETRVSALPVVNSDDLLVGMLSVGDLLRLVQDTEQILEDPSRIYENCLWVTELIRDTLGDDEVTSAMSCAPLTARHDDSLQHAAQMMLKHHVHHLPITTPEKKLVGLISSLDFVRLAAQSS